MCSVRAPAVVVVVAALEASAVARSSVVRSCVMCGWRSGRIQVAPRSTRTALVGDGDASRTCVRHWPPTRSRASRTAMRRLASRQDHAAVRPEIPAPMMTTSYASASSTTSSVEAAASRALDVDVVVVAPLGLLFLDPAVLLVLIVASR
ncbi:hypothetical protein DFJ73DRAFT_842592 [Zopfochytrium polystomum]|nr:hypothetical protein DFJ73DRAFT_842592 [Zopfochytrium polystomum]